MRNVLMLCLVITLFGCDSIRRDGFKKTFDECYANIPPKSQTLQGEPVLDRGHINRCYNTAIQLNAVLRNQTRRADGHDL